ncbi:hypothetical protein L1987_56804 [Smallanthus sonchifolius]|uniref:Uncharacterized protein n=1 Tax=Smallanthus sonchifolius TaxID=185202 RepID=A0ACB9DAT2_9ASTR|nr:hypothetical protein L1987_56804 [Smallanthus sonchifolius]
MMGEEFDESEVTFMEVEEQNTQENRIKWQHHKLKTKNKKKPERHSIPISIPKSIERIGYVESDLFEDDYEYERIVPPHVILGRRVARKVACSICTGCGRTSKGRELIQVRDLIIRFMDHFKKLFNKKKEVDGYWTWFACNLASGGAAGASSLFFVYSLDYARTRLANEAKAAKKAGEGRYQYKGVPSQVVKGGLKRVFALGWVITNGAGLASYPIHTVRRRMMMTSGQAVKYKSSMNAFTRILKKEGPKSLFKGAAANILRPIADAGVCSPVMTSCSYSSLAKSMDLAAVNSISRI